MVMQTVCMRATATGRVATAPRAPASLGGKGVAVRRSAPVAPLRSDFLGFCSLGGMCSALAGDRRCQSLSCPRAALRV